MSTVLDSPAPETADANPFSPGLWSKEINVRDFIQEHYTPYYGDESFLAGATKRTPRR